MCAQDKMTKYKNKIPNGKEQSKHWILYIAIDQVLQHLR